MGHNTSTVTFNGATIATVNLSSYAVLPTSGSATYLANATGSTIRVYYSVDKMVQTELVKTVGATVGNKGGSASVGKKMKFITGSNFLRIPKNTFIRFTANGAMYASVYMEGSSDQDECVKIISENFKSLCGRSFIVAADGSIKLQKEGQNLWMDEDGKMHRRDI